MNVSQTSSMRYRVVFGKDAQDLEEKLNDAQFVPHGYSLTHLTFNSAKAEYLVILQDSRDTDSGARWSRAQNHSVSVVFGKDAQDLEEKLNDPQFVPSGYSLTHLTFNSAKAEYLVILQDGGDADSRARRSRVQNQ